MKRSSNEPDGNSEQKRGKVSINLKDIVCCIKWCSDNTMRVIRVPPIQQGANCPCPLAPGCHGQFLRASTNKMEWAIILGAAYIKEKAVTSAMNYLREQQNMLLHNVEDQEVEEPEVLSDVEVYINGQVSNREVSEGSKTWDETLPSLNE
ncbi:putative Fe(2+)-trafficking protein [Frankliniella fusca]|uniref:Fe(2+)-trafficking protein n=1 Tax=Frankliniella fusca TaxID=407009 RepID=A0AAE1GWJ4_9NEOP|nr:putative Fe(2+)-trafficking protein [Frankliniella fusca]